MSEPMTSSGRMNSERRLTLIIPILGVILYLGFIVLDVIVYPGLLIPFFIIRTITVAWLITVTLLFVFRKIDSLLPLLYQPIAALGISLMCYISGEGFGSIYFVGILLVIIGSAVYTRLTEKQHASVLLVIAGQHFLLQSMRPFTLEDIAVNIFFLASAIVVSVAIKFVSSRLSAEIETLQGLLPICMYCKRIRTDSGAWDRIEEYLSQRVDVDFTHGICPECSDRFMKQIDDLKDDTGQKSGHPS